MKKAEILIEALPYIQELHGEYIVIKYGGHAMLDEELKHHTLRDTILLKYIGAKPIIVHGGGPEITKAMEKLGKKPIFIEGLRVTDRETLDIVQMVLVGKINIDLVSKANQMGAKAVGLSGKDARLIVAEKKKPVKVKDTEVDLGYVGEIKEVNTDIIEILTENGYIPIISPIGFSNEGIGYNLNADTVAGYIAGSLKAKKLIILTDVPGVLRDLNDEKSLIKEMKKEEIDELIEKNIVKGSMIPKLLACKKALEMGVEKAHIIDGRVKHAILLELFTDEGIGTMIF